MWREGLGGLCAESMWDGEGLKASLPGPTWVGGERVPPSSGSGPCARQPVCPELGKGWAMVGTLPTGPEEGG